MEDRVRMAGCERWSFPPSIYKHARGTESADGRSTPRDADLPAIFLRWKKIIQKATDFSSDNKNALVLRFFPIAGRIKKVSAKNSTPLV